MKKKVVVIIVLVALAMTALWIYYPRTVEFEVPIINEQGETSVMSANLKKNFFFTKPSTFRGVIAIDGESFELSNPVTAERKFFLMINYENGAYCHAVLDYNKGIFTLSVTHNDFEDYSTETVIWTGSLLELQNETMKYTAK